MLRAFVAFFFSALLCASSVPSLSAPARLAPPLRPFAFRAPESESDSDSAPPGLRLLLLPPLRPPPSSSAPAFSSVIKRGYFSVGLLKLTFL